MILSFADVPRCNNREDAVKCVRDGPSDYCPRSEYDDIGYYSVPSNCDEPGCRCKLNYRRLNNGTCVPIRDCRSYYCIYIYN